jgi:hypothetical protein
MKFLLKLKRFVCDFRNHPHSRVFGKMRFKDYPWHGYYTIYCPDCNIFWDEMIDETLPRENIYDECEAHNKFNNGVKEAHLQ